MLTEDRSPTSGEKLVPLIARVVDSPIICSYDCVCSDVPIAMLLHCMCFCSSAAASISLKL